MMDMPHTVDMPEKNDKGSIQEGLASKHTVPSYEKPVRYSKKLGNTNGSHIGRYLND